MLVLITLVILLLFLGTLFRTAVVNINTPNYVAHKGIIFALLCTTQFVVNVMYRFSKGCEPLYGNSLDYAFKTALVGVIGYSIFLDVNSMAGVTANSKQMVNKMVRGGYGHHVSVTLSIVGSIFMYQIMRMMTYGDVTHCDLN